jgi:hypothetical protein
METGTKEEGNGAREGTDRCDGKKTRSLRSGRRQVAGGAPAVRHEHLAKQRRADGESGKGKAVGE